MDDIMKDMGIVEQPAQVEAPQNEPVQTQVEQPQGEPTIIDEVLSLNDEQPNQAEPPAQEVNLTPTVEVDRGAILNELFGVADPESIKTRLAEYETLKSQAEKPRYQSKLAEIADNLVAKYGDPKSQADAFKSTLDILVTDADTLDDKTALAFQMKQDYPSLESGEIDLLISSKYNLTDYATEEQQKIGAIQLKLDSQKAKLAIKQMQADAFKDIPGKSTLQQVDEQKRQLDWKPKTQEIANAITSFEFEVDKGKKMKFDIPETEKAKLASLAESIALGSGWLPDSQSAKQVQDIVKMTWLYENAAKLVSNAYKKGLSQSNAEWSQKVHNPSGLKNTSGGMDFEKKQSSDEVMVDWLVQQFGG